MGDAGDARRRHAVMRDINVTGSDHSSLPDVTEYIENGRLVIPEGIEYILEESCYGRDDLVEVFLPSTMKVIGPVAFAECPSLTAVHLNEGLTEIGDGAFLGTVQLTGIELPGTLKTIGQMAFYGSGLTSVLVPASVEFIGEMGFWECASLRRADVLNPACVIEQDAFGDCPALVQGYMAPGFPKDDLQPSNLLFSLLWASEYDKHLSGEVRVSAEERRDYTSMHIYADVPRELQTVSERAMTFIRKNQGLVLETILRQDNTPAMRGIREYDLLSVEALEQGLREAAASGKTELASLFLSAKAKQQTAKGTGVQASTSEFEL
ncbi:MAG: leucine-rich repeat domain-containing protein [Mogibacterium sp.]|nr:leucine-rich repeat domain-containing protein [Mogibacterium sp.]